MPTVKPEYLDVLELLDSWRFESQPDIDDPGVNTPSPELYKTTVQIVTWCDLHRIDGSIFWEVYRQIQASRPYRNRDHEGPIGPRPSTETMEATYYKAVELQQRIFNLAIADQEGGSKQTDKPQIETNEAKAIAILYEHKHDLKWTDQMTADRVGIARQTLYDLQGYVDAKASLKEVRKKDKKQAREEAKRNLPHGSKDPETGKLEAWEE